MTYEIKYTPEMVLAAMTTSPELPAKIAKRLGCHTRTITRMMPQLVESCLVVRFEVSEKLTAYAKVEKNEKQ